MTFRSDLMQRAMASVHRAILAAGQEEALGPDYARKLCLWKADRCLQYIIANPPGLYWHQPTRQVVELVDYIEEHTKGHCAYLFINVAERGQVRAERSDIKKLSTLQLTTATIGDHLEF